MILSGASPPKFTGGIGRLAIDYSQSIAMFIPPVDEVGIGPNGPAFAGRVIYVRAVVPTRVALKVPPTVNSDEYTPHVQNRGAARGVIVQPRATWISDPVVVLERD
jgi:hypothetical protein